LYFVQHAGRPLVVAELQAEMRFPVVASVSDPSLISKCARPVMKLRLT